jgi:hypothetical protein
MRHLATFCALVVVLASCGLTSSVDEIPLNEAELAEGTLEEVNALIPVGSVVVFEEIIADDDGLIALAIAPDLWRVSTDGVGVDVEPIPGEGTELTTVMKIEAVCVGLCDRQDWAEYMYNDEFTPFLVAGDETVLRDRPLTAHEGRSLVVETPDGGRRILVALWNDRATHFYLCRVFIDPADVALTEAFTAACEGAVPLWLGRP